MHGNNVSYLRITDASRTYQSALNITCVAENYYGRAESTAFLHVLSGKLIEILPFLIVYFICI